MFSSGGSNACLMVTLRTPPEGAVLFSHEILTDSEARFGWLLALAQLADTSALTIRSFSAQADFSFPCSTTFLLLPGTQLWFLPRGAVFTLHLLQHEGDGSALPLRISPSAFFEMPQRNQPLREQPGSQIPRDRSTGRPSRLAAPLLSLSSPLALLPELSDPALNLAASTSEQDRVLLGLCTEPRAAQRIPGVLLCK